MAHPYVHLLLPPAGLLEQHAPTPHRVHLWVCLGLVYDLQCPKTALTHPCLCCLNSGHPSQPGSWDCPWTHSGFGLPAAKELFQWAVLDTVSCYPSFDNFGGRHDDGHTQQGAGSAFSGVLLPLLIHSSTHLVLSGTLLLLHYYVSEHRACWTHISERLFSSGRDLLLDRPLCADRHYSSIPSYILY